MKHRAVFCCAVVLAALIQVRAAGRSAADDAVPVTEISPRLFVLATRSGNVLVSVGADGAFLFGTPSTTSTAQISSFIGKHTESKVRFFVATDQAPEHSEGDGGWGKLGAQIAMQENCTRRLGGDVMGEPEPLPARLAALGVSRPSISFSEVLAFDVNGDSIHVVHQSPGYSDADTLTHFHVDNVVYFGEVFPGDGYPEVDDNQGGRIDGFLKTLAPWTNGPYKIVPARGKVTDAAHVKAFRDMILTVRKRVARLIAENRSEAEIIAEHPTSEFDARWGHGHISPETFVHAVYSSLKKK